MFFEISIGHDFQLWALEVLENQATEGEKERFKFQTWVLTHCSSLVEYSRFKQRFSRIFPKYGRIWGSINSWSTLDMFEGAAPILGEHFIPRRRTWYGRKVASYRMIYYSQNITIYMIDWLIDWLNDWLIAWLVGWLVDWLIHDWFIYHGLWLGFIDPS